GAWYEREIAERVLQSKAAPGRKRSLARIRRFEQILERDGFDVVKFWLHLDAADQKRRLAQLEDDEETAWRVTDRDHRLRKRHARLCKAAERVIATTDVGGRSWQIIPAAERKPRDLEIARRLIAAIEFRLSRPAHPPAGPPDHPPAPRSGPLVDLDLDQSLDRDEYQERRKRATGTLATLARRLHGEGRGLVMAFEGTDAAGKGGAIRRVLRGLDPRDTRLVSVGAPSEDERAHPWLWRFWTKVPSAGSVTIFDRTWYGRVLVERVEGFCAPEDWERAFEEIAAFERELGRAGIVVMKFWLQLSPEEQLRRFQARRRTPYKQYKLTEDDWRNREKWDAYLACATEMIARTGTEDAPWFVVPAEDKRLARVRVLEAAVDHLSRQL
ncbi:MAG: polyphosphate:AMP phosphotransferase, partial [Planctomycetes bacterium]|nr:polyphosphate:AMP phosphotransferase [Planctomycetota bacterium]